MPAAQIISRARDNGSVSPRFFGDHRISASAVVDLLVESAQPRRHPAVRRNANRVLHFMAHDAWMVTAGTHSGGFGGGGRAADGTNHITLRVAGHGYHLRQDARGHLFEITGPGLETLNPAASPGADIAARH